MVVVEIIGGARGILGRLPPTRNTRATAPVPRFNVLLLHLGNLPAECSCRFPFGLKVVRNLVCALVSQIEITFWDQKAVEKSSEWAF